MDLSSTHMDKGTSSALVVQVKFRTQMGMLLLKCEHPLQNNLNNSDPEDTMMFHSC